MDKNKLAELTLEGQIRKYGWRAALVASVVLAVSEIVGQQHPFGGLLFVGWLPAVPLPYVRIKCGREAVGHWILKTVMWACLGWTPVGWLFPWLMLWFSSSSKRRSQPPWSDQEEPAQTAQEDLSPTGQEDLAPTRQEEEPAPEAWDEHDPAEEEPLSPMAKVFPWKRASELYSQGQVAEPDPPVGQAPEPDYPREVERPTKPTRRPPGAHRRR